MELTEIREQINQVDDQLLDEIFSRFCVGK